MQENLKIFKKILSKMNNIIKLAELKILRILANKFQKNVLIHNKKIYICKKCPNHIIQSQFI